MISCGTKTLVGLCFCDSMYQVMIKPCLKALANEDTLLPTQNVSPFARARNICCGHKFCVRNTKNVSDFVQKHFVSATNVSQFAQPIMSNTKDRV